MRRVLKEIESVGFLVVHIVTDNHKINVAAFQMLCGANVVHIPESSDRKLVLAFNQCHVIKT